MSEPTTTALVRPLSKHGVRITEEDVRRGEVNPGLFLNEGQHRVNRAGSLGNRINVIVRSVGADGAAIIGEVKVWHLSGDPGAQLVRTFQRDFRGGEERDELAGFGGNFDGAAGSECEGPGRTQGRAHALQLIEGVLLEVRV